MTETQVIHLDQTIGDPLKDEFRQQLGKIITARTYEAFEEARRQYGTDDLVVMINANDGSQPLVFTRTRLLGDPSFPSNLRDRICVPARLSNLTFDVPTFWAIILWQERIAALAIGFQHMAPGGTA